MSKIVEDFKWRYACKKFDPAKKISKADLDSLLEVLRLTASSYGLQPWKFLVVENQQIRQQLMDSSWGQKQVVEAGHLLVLCSPKKIDEAYIDRYINDTAKARGQEPSELSGFKKMLMSIAAKDEAAQYQWAKNQVYIALGSLLSACAQMRIDSCPMEGFMAKDYDKILGLDDKGLTSMVVCPIGYRHTDDKYSSMEKIRFPLDELVVRI